MANENTKKQLLIKDADRYKNIFPINYIVNVIDFDSNENLESILKRFNHVMVSITGTKAVIRAEVPSLLRHKGLHISYIYDDKLHTEYYKGDSIVDSEWIKDANWGFTLNDNNNDSIVIKDGSIHFSMFDQEIKDAINSIVDITRLQATATAVKGNDASANVTYHNGVFSFNFMLPKGDKGDNFAVDKIYSSVAAMNAGYATDGVKLGGFVIIDTGSVEDEDTAKLYCKGDEAYQYITDLSGAKGIQGVGVASMQQTEISSADGGTNTWQATLTDGQTFDFVVKNGNRGERGPQGERGPKGDQGNPGPAGRTPTISFGISGTTLQVTIDGVTTNLIDLATLITKTRVVNALNQPGEVTMSQHWRFNAGVANHGTN